MDEANDGVIYFSLGSIVNTSEIYSGKAGKAFFSAFRKLPQRVIMKFEAERAFFEIPSNVMTLKWVPQQDVLGKEN